MNFPIGQSDYLVDSLWEKACKFTPNVILYFERDSYLQRSRAFPINHSAKDQKTDKSNKEKPHFDPMDIVPQVSVRSGKKVNIFKFSFSDYTFSKTKGWFLQAIAHSENQHNSKDPPEEFWVLSLNGQFYFYYPSDGHIDFILSSGAVTMKGRIVSFQAEDGFSKYFMVKSGGTAAEMNTFMTGCFNCNNLEPFEPLMRSFKMIKSYPEINEKTISFYRFNFQNPMFLLIIGLSDKRTEGSRKMVHIYLKAVRENIFSIVSVFVFFALRKNFKAIFKNGNMLIDAIRLQCSKDEKFIKAKELVSKQNPESLSYVELGSFAEYLLYVVYDLCNKAEETDKSLVSDFVSSFYLQVLMGLKISAAIKLENNSEFIANFAKRKYEMVNPELLSYEEVKAIIEDIRSDTALYSDVFSRPMYRIMVQNLHVFFNPKKEVKADNSNRFQRSARVLGRPKDLPLDLLKPNDKEKSNSPAKEKSPFPQLDPSSEPIMEELPQQLLNGLEPPASVKVGADLPLPNLEALPQQLLNGLAPPASVNMGTDLPLPNLETFPSPPPSSSDHSAFPSLPPSSSDHSAFPLPPVHTSDQDAFTPLLAPLPDQNAFQPPSNADFMLPLPPSPEISSGMDDIDPHTYDSFPINIPPPRKIDTSSFLMPVDSTSSDSSPVGNDDSRLSEEIKEELVEQSHKQVKLPEQEEEEVKILRAAPRYTGDEEEPPYPDDPSDTTIQEDE